MPGAARQGSLFAAIVETVGSREPVARLQKLEVLLGVVGFFALVTVVRTASGSLHGHPSAGDAILAALGVGVTCWLIRRWQVLGREVDEAERTTRRNG